MKTLQSLILAFSIFTSLPSFAQDQKTDAPTAVATVAPAAAEKPAAKVGYDNGFFLESADGKFRLSIGGYLRPYYEADFIEAGDDVSTFKVKRARLKFSGWAFSKEIQYEFEYDFALNRMLTGMLQWVPSDVITVHAGQYRVPFNFEQISSSATLQFVDRSIVQSFFGIPDEREPGMGVSGKPVGRKFEYEIGVFNGEGVNTLNQNNDMRWVGRFVWNVVGRHGYEFSDTKQSEMPSVALAVAGMYNDTPDPASIPSGGTKPAAEKQVASMTSDVSARYRGWGVHGAYIYQHTNPQISSSYRDQGWLAQVGYLVVSKTLEVALRASQVYPGTADKQGEYTAGLNYYIFAGHSVKWQIDYSLLTTANGVAPGNDKVDQRIRTQFQLKF